MVSVFWSIVALLLIGMLLIILLPTINFIKNRRLEEVTWKENKPEKVVNLGNVKKLSIMPLMDYYTSSDDLVGEPGVSYLINADDTSILFDVGYNPKNEHPSPLLQNMKRLGVEVNDIDKFIISHNHTDHVGGREAKKTNTFSISGQEINLNGVKAFVPEQMSHATAEVEVVKEPQKIAPGVASIGTIDRALWLMGLTAEQALAINVEGKGLVLIIGCGHQRIERIIERAQQLFDIPIYGVVGGLHFPIETSRMKFNMQRIFGTGKLPWQRIKKDEVREVITELSRLNLSLIGISAHDSCDWTLQEFRDTFKEKYIDVLVGKEILI